MKLDKRLSRIPYTCFEKDDCEEFVGHMGYFTDYIEDYSDLKECYHKRLKNILSEHRGFPFHATDNISHRFFFPDTLLKEPAKKLRPYKSFDEIPFLNLIIKIRKKGSEIYALRMAMGFNVDSDGILTSILFYGKEITIHDLFDNYEWQQGYEISDADEWKPFGVEENGIR